MKKKPSTDYCKVYLNLFQITAKSPHGRALSSLPYDMTDATVWQTARTGEGRVHITKRPFKKKALDTAVRTTVEGHTVNKRPR